MLSSWKAELPCGTGVKTRSAPPGREISEVPKRGRCFCWESPAAGGHRGGSPLCHAWPRPGRAPSPGRVPAGKRRGKKRTLPAPARPPKPPAEGGAAARPRLAPVPRRREPQGPAATGAPLPLASPGRGASGGGRLPWLRENCPRKTNPGGWFREMPNAALISRVPPRPQLVQPSVLTSKPAPNFCKRSKGSGSPNRRKQAFVTLRWFNLGIRKQKKKNQKTNQPKPTQTGRGFP